MKEEFNPANLWFSRTFSQEKQLKRKIYEGFCEGFTAYHDIYIDEINWDDPTQRHRLEFDWKNEFKTVDVYIYPFFGNKKNEDRNFIVSDPPVPPPPPPPTGF